MEILEACGVPVQVFHPIQKWLVCLAFNGSVDVLYLFCTGGLVGHLAIYHGVQVGGAWLAQSVQHATLVLWV